MANRYDTTAVRAEIDQHVRYIADALGIPGAHALSSEDIALASNRLHNLLAAARHEASERARKETEARIRARLGK